MLNSTANSDDFLPTARAEVLRIRARLLRKLRQFFDDGGFLEVETPLLSADVVVDRHIDPLTVTLTGDPREPSVGRTLWLQTSPEFHMKRMLAGGEYDAIYQITKSFRGGERGPLHNPEFTIVEWYRTGDDMQAGMELLSELAAAMFGSEPAERLSYTEAFIQHAGIHPLTASQEALQTFAVDRKLSPPQNLDRDGLLDFLLLQLVETNLGRDRPTILHRYPASQGALARVSTDDAGHAVAERFELYVDGIELANGYHELLDADELLRRNNLNNDLRQADGKPALPTDSRLLTAMARGLPACTGVALGFDRLVMLAAGATSLDEVMAFPIERA